MIEKSVAEAQPGDKLCRKGAHVRILGTRRCRACQLQNARGKKQLARDTGRIPKKNTTTYAHVYTTFRHNKIKKFWIDKLGGACARCGFNEALEALDFDHINPEQKTYDISWLINSKTPPDIVEQEMQKCQILCANCHRSKTKNDAIKRSVPAGIEEIPKGALIEVTWLQVNQDPTGDPSKAFAPERRTYGILEAVKDNCIVLSFTQDDLDVFGQNGWLSIPRGSITRVRLVRKLKARPRAGLEVGSGTVS